jgi:hypothetical protein
MMALMGRSRHRLLGERALIVRRLHDLARGRDQICLPRKDAETRQARHVALCDRIDRTTTRLRAIDEELAKPAEVIDLATRQAAPDTPLEQVQAAERRLRLIVAALNELPRSCQPEAAALSRKIEIELGRIQVARAKLLRRHPAAKRITCADFVLA